MPNVEYIGDSAFRGCTSMTHVCMPSLRELGGPDVFHMCDSLMEIDVGPDNPDFATSGGALYDKGMTTLIRFPSGVTGSFATPDAVEVIGERSFQGSSLSSLTISESVREIGFLSLSDCDGLVEIRFESKDFTSSLFTYVYFLDENGDPIDDIDGSTVGGMTFVLYEGSYIPESCVPEDDSAQHFAVGAVIFVVVAILAYLAYRRD